MHTIFYNYLLGTKKLGTIVTEKSPSQLIAEGVIPAGAAYLVRPEKTADMTEEEQIKYMEIEYAHFDNYDNPTDIIVDYPSIMFSLIEELRGRRNQVLEKLDKLQQRALVKRKDDLVDEMEEDKQKLRDCLNIDVTKYKCLNDFRYYVPDLLYIDYEVKFSERLNA